MEVKVSCLPFSSQVICWVLNRRKIINIHVIWNNDDSSWVLSSRSFNTCRTLRQSFYFCITIKFIVIPLIAFHKTISCFGSDCTNRTSTKGIFFTKNISNIQVSTRLIFSRKVQVNIRYLITVKTKEGFKRNILSIFTQLMPTMRTIFIWHIKA